MYATSSLLFILASLAGQPAPQQKAVLQQRSSCTEVFLDVKVVLSTDRRLHEQGIRIGDLVLMDGVATLEPSQAKAVLRELAKSASIRQLPKCVVASGEATNMGYRAPDLTVTAVPRIVAGSDRIVVDLSLCSSLLSPGKDQPAWLFAVRSGQTAVLRHFSAPDRGVIVFVNAEAVSTPVTATPAR